LGGPCPDIWRAPANAPTFNVGTILLLTDGSVLAQDAGTRHWWQLTPDSTGRYFGGTWREVRSSHHAPLNFASAVLRDGRVFIAGGEKDSGQPADLCAAELYDPVADRWSDLPTPAGWNAIGDAPWCVLPDGRVLLGSIRTHSCALFDPDTLTWTETGSNANSNSSGETWTLLPDGSVLTVDCFNHPLTQRYVDGRWIDNGPTDTDLVEYTSKRTGPSMLLANQQVLAIGATGDTSLFKLDQSPPWQPGPKFLSVEHGQLAAKDAPACLLPNGRVLCVAGPWIAARKPMTDLLSFLNSTLTQKS
jgi:hypothetical protein